MARDGKVAWLPDRLPDLQQDLRWTCTLPSDGVGGLIATEGRVVVSSRDASDQRDRFTALDLDTGRLLWTYQYEALAKLDYGNSPRATPAAADGVVVTLGGTGVLSSLDAETGVPLWSVDLSKRFDTAVPTWGFSGSPLLIDGSIYLQVGKESSLVAIDVISGKTKWQVAGAMAAYSSLMPMNDGKWIVGVDDQGYFVRRSDDGSLVWSFEPELSGDFGVPSPVTTEQGVIFTSENNGVQLIPYKAGRLAGRAAAVNERLIPDSHTPVLVANQLLVAHDGLHALNIRDGLSENWSAAESIISGYASIIASPDRALVTTENGHLLLFDINGKGAILDQRRLTDDNVSVLSHPAVSGHDLLLRVGDQVRCYRFPQ